MLLNGSYKVQGLLSWAVPGLVRRLLTGGGGTRSESPKPQMALVVVLLQRKVTQTGSVSYGHGPLFG